MKIILVLLFNMVAMLSAATYEIEGFVSYVKLHQGYKGYCHCHLAIQSKDLYYSQGVHSSTCYICEAAATAMSSKQYVKLKCVTKGYYKANDVVEIIIGKGEIYWPNPNYGKLYKETKYSQSR